MTVDLRAAALCLSSSCCHRCATNCGSLVRTSCFEYSCYVQIFAWKFIDLRQTIQKAHVFMSTTRVVISSVFNPRLAVSDGLLIVLSCREYLGLWWASAHYVNRFIGRIGFSLWSHSRMGYCWLLAWCFWHIASFHTGAYELDVLSFFCDYGFHFFVKILISRVWTRNGIYYLLLTWFDTFRSLVR